MHSLELNLHNILRLSLSEASRPELWNSIIIQNKSALDYISYRTNLSGELRELKVSDVFIEITWVTYTKVTYFRLSGG